MDEAVVMAAGMLLTDEVLDRTKQIIKETLDLHSKIEARALEQGRLERDLERAETRVKAAEDLLLDAEGAERAHLRVTLREQLAKRDELRAAQQQFKAGPAADPKAVLEQLDARVDELRDGLQKGGIEALPAVEDLLGGDRLNATRREDGRWDLAGEADPISVFYGESGVVKVGTKQKAKLKGNVTGVVVTPVTSQGSTVTSQAATPSDIAAVPASASPVAPTATPAIIAGAVVTPTGH